MDLYKEILVHALMRGEMQITFPEQTMNLCEILESQCYQTLQKIKEIIHDSSLEGSECFMKIEMIICALEEIGSNGGSRHDFG